MLWWVRSRNDLWNSTNGRSILQSRSLSMSSSFLLSARRSCLQMISLLCSLRSASPSCTWSRIGNINDEGRVGTVVPIRTLSPPDSRSEDKNEGIQHFPWSLSGCRACNFMTVALTVDHVPSRLSIWQVRPSILLYGGDSERIWERPRVRCWTVKQQQTF